MQNERCVAARCINVAVSAYSNKNNSMHIKIPLFGEESPITRKRRKRWINFVLER